MRDQLLASANGKELRHECNSKPTAEGYSKQNRLTRRKCSAIYRVLGFSNPGLRSRNIAVNMPTNLLLPFVACLVVMQMFGLQASLLICRAPVTTKFTYLHVGWTIYNLPPRFPRIPSTWALQKLRQCDFTHCRFRHM